MERMTGGSRLGMPIVVLFVVVAVVNWFFGGGTDNWFVSTAQRNAVRCLTQSPCTMLKADGGIVAAAPPPLASGDACAQRKNWRQLKSGAKGPQQIVLTCNGILYHMGRLPGRDAGNEQWMRCANTSCAAEAKLIAAK